MRSYSMLGLAMSLLSLTVKLTTALPTPGTLNLPRDDTTSSNPWSVQVTIGKSSISVGDITDGSYFAGLLSPPCGPSGCAPDDPQSFTSHIVKHTGGYAEKLSGQLVMTGDYNNWSDLTRTTILETLGIALKNSIQCNSVSYTYCGLAARENGRASQACTPSTIMQCTIADYVSAAAYGPAVNGVPGAMEGSIHMSATSTAPQGLDCGTIVDIVSGVLGPLDVPAFGALSGVATAVCDLVG